MPASAPQNGPPSSISLRTPRDGFAIDELAADDGVSGLSTRFAEQHRPKLGGGDILVVRWVDWLGRNYEERPHTDPGDAESC
jgi:hypothetical protein